MRFIGFVVECDNVFKDEGLMLSMIKKITESDLEKHLGGKVRGHVKDDDGNSLFEGVLSKEGEDYFVPRRTLKAEPVRLVKERTIIGFDSERKRGKVPFYEY